MKKRTENAIASMLAEIGAAGPKIIPEGTGFTAEEYATQTGYSRSGSFTKIRQLRDENRIRCIGKRRVISNGRPSWRKVYEPVRG